MPRIGPIRRDDLIRHLRKLNFTGPWSGGRHPFRRCGELSLHIPNSHSGDIGQELLIRILRQAGISLDEWEQP